MPKAKKVPGRPPKYTMPDGVDSPVDEIAKKVLSMPPKKVWRYPKDDVSEGGVHGNIVDMGNI